VYTRRDTEETTRSKEEIRKEKAGCFFVKMTSSNNCKGPRTDETCMHFDGK
jgi:hypothetical protein